MMQQPPNNRQRRFDREFERVAQLAPWVRRLRQPGWMLVRILLGCTLFLGGFLAILPVFGLWMIPLGLLLLAIDIPALQGPVSSALIKLRHWWRHRRK